MKRETDKDSSWRWSDWRTLFYWYRNRFWEIGYKRYERKGLAWLHNQMAADLVCVSIETWSRGSNG
jgi:hypothetical protein